MLLTIGIVGSIGIISALFVSFYATIKRRSAQKINNDNDIDNDDNNDTSLNKFIYRNYKNSLDSLFGGEESEIFLFFVNQDDPNDIKLPYQFLSIQKSLKEDRLFVLDIPDDYIQLTFKSRDHINDVVLRYPDFKWLTNSHYNNYNAYPKTSDIHVIENNEFQLSQFDSGLNLQTFCSNLKKFIDKNQLNPELLIDYYTRIIKQKQPSLDEKYEILTQFEKAKDQAIRLNTLNNQNKVDELIKDYNNKGYNNDTYSKVNEELLNLVNKSNKSNK